MRVRVPSLQRHLLSRRSGIRRSSTEAEGATSVVSAPPRLWAGRELREVVILAGKRTPIGGYGGSLSALTATQLGSISIRAPSVSGSAALEQAKLSELLKDKELVPELYMGNVLSTGLGQAPARQAALGAGLPEKTVCTTVNKVCASGMKAVVLGVQSICLGLTEVVFAGGMESMSNAPYILRRSATASLGHVSLKDSIFTDGLWDAYKDMSMGSIAENTAREMNISRWQQDEHAVQSYERAAAAQAKGRFKSEIAPVTVPGKKGKQPVEVTSDEEIAKFDPEKLLSLRPAFEPDDGTITAGNSSSISDGAAVLVLASAEFAERNGLPVLARVRGYADAEQAPQLFPTSPSLAIPRALKNAGLSLAQADLFEINEAFSVVDLANRQLLGLEAEQVNLHGGAVALGHPIGASGARIIISLMTTLAYENQGIGVASVCNGGGGASAIVIEREKSYRFYEHEIGHSQKNDNNHDSEREK